MLFKNILKDWNFIRGLRFVLGLIVLVQSIMYKNYLLGLFGLYFSIMALFNLGCNGASCNVNNNYSKKEEDFTYEEVHTPK